MNSRLLSALALPRGRVIAGLVAAAAFAVLPATAQQPPAQQQPAAPKAPPKAAPKTPPAAKKDAPPAAAQQQPAQPAQPQQDQVQLIYSPWTKFCLKGQDANAKQVCFTGKDGRIESGQPVVAASSSSRKASRRRSCA